MRTLRGASLDYCTSRSYGPLGITKRFAWLVLPDPIMTDCRSGAASVVSIQRLMELSARLREVTNIDNCSADHLLLRFNLLNLSDESVTVCAIGLRSPQQERLRCEVVPSVAFESGARYPFAVEVRSKLGSAASR